MKNDKQRDGRPNGPRAKTPANPWRALIIGLLAARALGLLDVSTDAGLTVTVTTYRICFSHDCSHTRLSGLATGPTEKTIRMHR